MKFYKIKSLRKLILPAMKKLGPKDITVRHHHTGDKIKLNFFKHKGYWYHGKNREKNTMNTFARLINAGDTVVEVGGHVGYISLYFSKLTGEKGKVIVFEPGENNLPYIENNVKSRKNITIVKKAVSEKTGTVSFFIDNLTGQNNSLNQEYEGFKHNQKSAFTDTGYREVTIDAITLDEYVKTNNLKPDFVKIDIEGAEVLALRGMQNLLATVSPKMMIEITDNRREVFDILQKNNYLLFKASGEKVTDYTTLNFNTFCLHQEKHRKAIEMLSV